jgi:simple sugar transport system ATP-binding protein
VGAAELVHTKLLQLRDKGAAILLISADLSEVLDLSDRLLVLYNGRIVAFFKSGEHRDIVSIGEYMLGLKKMDPEQIKEVI